MIKMTYSLVGRKLNFRWFSLNNKPDLKRFSCCLVPIEWWKWFNGNWLFLNEQILSNMVSAVRGINAYHIVGNCRGKVTKLSSGGCFPWKTFHDKQLFLVNKPIVWNKQKLTIFSFLKGKTRKNDNAKIVQKWKEDSFHLFKRQFHWNKYWTEIYILLERCVYFVERPSSRGFSYLM